MWWKDAEQYPDAGSIPRIVRRDVGISTYNIVLVSRISLRGLVLRHGMMVPGADEECFPPKMSAQDKLSTIVGGQVLRRRTAPVLPHECI
eukprot:2809077-Rhodomonas_salina.1